jgi:hypothetical protein
MWKKTPNKDPVKLNFYAVPGFHYGVLAIFVRNLIACQINCTRFKYMVNGDETNILT